MTIKHLKSVWIYLVLIAICLTPLLWFINHPGQLINGLDTNFPLNPRIWFQRRLFVWNDSLNGGIDMNSSVGGLFFHFLQYFPYILGVSLGVTQKLTFIFWFGMILTSSFIFAKTFLTTKKILQLFFVLLYCFNIYLFNTWENIKVANLALVVGLPLTLSFIELYRRNKISARVLFCLQILIAVISSGSGINPSYFIAMILAVVFYVLIYLLMETRVRLLKGSVITAFSFLLGSLFWIVPLADFLFFSSKVSTLESIGFTNWVASLSQNTSLVNVMRLLGAWDWYVKDNANTPIYIPYAAKYFNSLPFIFMSFIVPLFAFMGLVIKRPKLEVPRIYFLCLAVVGVFLGAGLHEPTGTLFAVFLNKVPFFSFFRSPWYIFTPYTIIGFGSLAVFFLDSLWEKIPKRIYQLGLFVVIIGYILYSYPLWTGKIFRPLREDSFYVTTPSYVFDFANYISNSDYNRIITYPDDQLEQFKWGYKGTDSFLGLLVDKEVYAPSFNYPNKYIENYLNQFYLRLKKGHTVVASKMLSPIGVDSLLLKSDANTLSPDITSKFTGKESKQFGPWTLLSIEPNASLVSIPVNIFEGSISSESLSFVLPYLPESSTYVTQGDSQLEKLPSSFHALSLIESRPQQELSSQNYLFTVPQDGDYTLLIEKAIPEDSKVEVLLDGSKISVLHEYEDALLYQAKLTKGKHTLSTNFSMNTTTLPLESRGELPLSQVVQSNERLSFPVSNFNPFVQYELVFDYKYSYGNTPQIELVQSYEKAPLKVENVKVSKNQDWLQSRFAFDPVPLSSKLEVIIKIAENADSHISSSFVKNMHLNRVVKNRLFVFDTISSPEASPHVTLNKSDPTRYTAQISNTKNGYFLLFKENYQSGWKISSNNYIGGKPVHLQANGMYNLWFIPVGDISQTININFEPQKSYQVALFISVLAVLGSIVTLMLILKRKYEKQQST